ncbi:MarR family winged helix-turn-helix transcriptional regulator [Methanobacterium formicicum]|uniref:Regulatory protein MarR n=1 Tax=Methanobacterium formicicum (strain DSM 3637 / PP1) TaxID=1204725 RepID=K2R187_METFP|nr:MarR family transcriptional regulator [Methanobacterium formicicum]EKF86283.1 regulatory protein MarR [Methanobacterium formicicum DSM 3637]
MVNENVKMETMLDDLLIYFPIFYQKVRTSKDFKEKQTSAAYYQIMGLLMDLGSLPISVIGDYLYISRPNMTSHIDKLVLDGMVERKGDEKDRRITLISITPEGRDFMKKARVKVEENMLNNLSSLSDAEMEELFTAVKTIKKLLFKIKDVKNE